MKIQEIRMGKIDLDHMFEQDFLDLQSFQKFDETLELALTEDEREI